MFLPEPKANTYSFSLVRSQQIHIPKLRIKQESQTQSILNFAAPQAEFLAEHLQGIMCNAACSWQN